jgi:hypothetical protein
MEFESILVSKALPDGTFSQKAVFDTHRTITSSNDLRDFTAGTVRSSRGKVDACVYTRESVCREAASFKRVWRRLKWVLSPKPTVGPELRSG